MKKTGLGKDPLSWIQPTVSNRVKEVKASSAPLSPAAGQPKFRTFEVRLTTLLRSDQLEFLERLVREIQKNRSTAYRQERITKNTLIRVFIDTFKEARFDTTNIPDESALLQRVRRLLH
ncbi:MAG TPA: hypothetical protein PKX93_02255 [bacterium]|nr:hypothetical protein [bacterium]HPP12109.1 hypothetical protein [bacterium]